MRRHSPPTRLRRFDLFLVDEASQIKDHVAKKIYMVHTRAETTNSDNHIVDKALVFEDLTGN